MKLMLAVTAGLVGLGLVLAFRKCVRDDECACAVAATRSRRAQGNVRGDSTKSAKKKRKGGGHHVHEPSHGQRKGSAGREDKKGAMEYAAVPADDDQAATVILHASL